MALTVMCMELVYLNYSVWAVIITKTLTCKVF